MGPGEMSKRPWNEQRKFNSIRPGLFWVSSLCVCVCVCGWGEGVVESAHGP